MTARRTAPLTDAELRRRLHEAIAVRDASPSPARVALVERLQQQLELRGVQLALAFFGTEPS